MNIGRVAPYEHQPRGPLWTSAAWPP